MSGPSNPTLGVFDAPTKYVEDNSVMPAGTVIKYQLGLGQTDSAYTIIKDDIDLTPNAQGKQTVPIPLSSLSYGQWYSAVRAVSKDGPVSQWSVAAPFTVDAKTPEKPANFAVT